MSRVVELADIDTAAVESVLASFGLELIRLPKGHEIPASYWGAPEAGIAARSIFARTDTPVHSVLHEAGHYVCMTPERRAQLWRNAGGDDAEESAVCYLQVLLGEELDGFGARQMLADLDAWGYSFRQGSARAWFVGDGLDARRWLIEHRLIDVDARPTRRLRTS